MRAAVSRISIALKVVLLLAATTCRADQAAENQFTTALLTALAAAETNNADMATFANQHLHQATYCLMRRDAEPMGKISTLIHNLATPDQLAHFEQLKGSFDVAQTRADNPCINTTQTAAGH